ncbi:MAG TPA: hypothetical protein ENI14_03155, partial [Thermoplasmatales archaeon]|nr:hypothetical protein [Thermoplasmatales archaeon]
LSFKACDGKNYRRALESAVGIELAHSASLVHDDIIDEDNERRGKPSLHVKKGLGVAILTGHRMINEAFRIALKHGKRNAFIFLDTWNETLEGELKDVEITSKLIEYIKRGDLRKLYNEYFKVIDLKTASLFSAACRAGAIEANAPEDLIEILAKYGKEVGISYQLADDLVDIISGKFDEGLVLPLVRLYKGKESEIAKIVEGNNKILLNLIINRKEDLKEIYLKEIRRHVKNAERLASSEKIKDSLFKDMLREAPRYIVNKMLENVGGII